MERSQDDPKYHRNSATLSYSNCLLSSLIRRLFWSLRLSCWVGSPRRLRGRRSGYRPILHKDQEDLALSLYLWYSLLTLFWSIVLFCLFCIWSILCSPLGVFYCILDCYRVEDLSSCTGSQSFLIHSFGILIVNLLCLVLSRCHKRTFTQVSTSFFKID